MDRLNIMEGVGHKLRQNHIEYLQAANRDAFAALTSQGNITGKTTFIISGCNVIADGGNYNISAGWISIANEVVKVDAHVVAAAAGYVFGLVETNEGVALEYEDGSSHYVYKKRRAVMSSGVGGGYATPFLFPRMSDGYRRLGDAADIYYSVADGLLTFQNDFTEYTTGVYRKLMFRIEQGLLILAGRIGTADFTLLPAVAGWYVITKLPDIMRPTKAAFFKAVVDGPSDYFELIGAKLETNGELSVRLTPDMFVDGLPDISFDGERIALE